MHLQDVRTNRFHWDFPKAAIATIGPNGSSVPQI
jgi:hypothetical protein